MLDLVFEEIASQVTLVPPLSIRALLTRGNYLWQRNSGGFSKGLFPQKSTEPSRVTITILQCTNSSWPGARVNADTITESLAKNGFRPASCFELISLGGEQQEFVTTMCLKHKEAWGIIALSSPGERQKGYYTGAASVIFGTYGTPIHTNTFRENLAVYIHPDEKWPRLRAESLIIKSIRVDPYPETNPYCLDMFLIAAVKIPQ